MRRKVKLAIIIAIMSLMLCACGAYASTGTGGETFGSFVVLEKLRLGNSNEPNMCQYILYDPDTKVMYTFVGSSGGSGGLSVMYNPDGTIMTYSPER